MPNIEDYNPHREDVESAELIARNDRELQKKVLESENSLAKRPRPERTPLEIVRHPIKHLEELDAHKFATRTLESRNTELENFRRGISEQMDRLQEEAQRWQAAQDISVETQERIAASMGQPEMPTTLQQFFEDMDSKDYERAIAAYRASEKTGESRAAEFEKLEKEEAEGIAVQDYFTPHLPTRKGAYNQDVPIIEINGIEYAATGGSDRYPREDVGTSDLEEAISDAKQKGGRVIVITTGNKYDPKTRTEKYIVIEPELAPLIDKSVGRLNGTIEATEITGEKDGGMTLAKYARYDLRYSSALKSPEELAEENEEVEVTVTYDKRDPKSKRTDSESTTISGKRKDVQYQVSRFSLREDVANIKVDKGEGETVPWDSYIPEKLASEIDEVEGRRRRSF